MVVTLHLLVIMLLTVVVVVTILVLVVASLVLVLLLVVAFFCSLAKAQIMFPLMLDVVAPLPPLMVTLLIFKDVIIIVNLVIWLAVVLTLILLLMPWSPPTLPLSHKHGLPIVVPLVMLRIVVLRFLTTVVVRIRFLWVMVKVCKFLKLVMVPSLNFV